jgi:DNA-binding transcriptional MerR regulator
MDKSPDAFRTISEVAELLETPAHVLRFWESRFPQIKPVKRAGGRRYYRPADMALLSGIRRLLHDEGMTIRGVQKILREQGVRHVSGLTEEEDAALEMVEDMEEAVASSDPIPLFGQVRKDDADVGAVPEALADNARVAGDEDAALDAVPEALADDGAEAVIAAPAQTINTAAPEGVADDVGADDVEEIAQDYAQDLGESDGDAAGALEDVTQPSPPQMDAVAQPMAPAEVRAAPRENLCTDAPDLPFDAPVAEGAAQDVSESPVAEAEPVAAVAEPGDVAVAAAEEVEDLGLDDLAPVPVPVPAAIVAAPQPTPKSAPEEIVGHWLPADLRALRPDALVGRVPQAAALLQRLDALRNRVGDRGRVPRR